MSTTYEISVPKGRIGKARQVADFTVEVDGAVGDLDELSKQILRKIRRHIGTKRAWLRYKLQPNTTVFHAEVWTEGIRIPAAELVIDQVEN